MVTFTGISSVIDRTLFTNRGPIVKKPLPVLTGSNLRVVSEQVVEVPTAGFTSSDVGYVIELSGSPGQRNDGEFTIAEVLTSTRVKLSGASFDVSDVDLTVQDIVSLSNELRQDYEAHRTQHIDEDEDGTDEGVHGTDDTVNVVIAPEAFDMTTAITLLNDLRSKFSSHVTDVSGDPMVHKQVDALNVAEAPAADNLPSAINLVNDLRRKYESHRQKRDVHQVDDSVNRVDTQYVEATVGVYPGPLTGPFPWTLKDPRLGTVADDPTDVEVLVNGSPAAVDAVFGLLGAVVLQSKPAGPDTVFIDYSFLENPPARFLRLNSPEFNLNQWGNRGLSGLPKHKYRARSYMIDPGNSPDLMSFAQPKKVGWKYKGLERAYTAVLNDPTTLLLNVPTNRVSYPVLFEKVREVTVRYDPTSLPQDATDPWVLNGEGTLSLAPGGNELTVVDLNVQTGPDSAPPFFHHEVNLDSPSIVSAAFRALALDDESLVKDGVFTGVAFGFSDGRKAVVVGFVETESTNLSSALVMANDMKAAFNAHLSNVGSHNPNDVTETVEVVNASDQESLNILLNELKSRYSAHIAKGSGAGNVHATADVTNVVSSPDATDLATALTLVNELRDAFNLHREQAGTHFFSDTVNSVGLVKQVGVLTNRDFPEFQGAWESFAQDWTQYATYRIFLDSDGSAQVFRSGDVTPAASVPPLELPAISDIDGRFDPVQQTFFGPIGRDSTNTSKWQFVRVNIAPVDGNLIEGNKLVDYDGSVLPELDPSSPWITVGQAGSERILSPDVLLLDSTASTPGSDLEAYGMASGNFRGLLRLEPVLTKKTTAAVEFSFSGDFYTHGLDNSATAVVLDDEDFTVQVSFLQFSPSAGTVTGTASEPFLIVMNDELILRVENGPLQTVVFQTGDTTAALVAARVNGVVGYPMVDVVSGRVRFTSPGLGASSSFEIVEGNAIAKLGLSPGPYAGTDSNPEPRVSWFGGDTPDRDDPVWSVGGAQASTMLGRTMRVTDSDVGDFLAYTLDDNLVTNQAFNSTVDWKLDFRLKFLSYQAGTALTAAGPYASLLFAGALVSVDEGPAGKNIEVHFSTDGSGGTFLNLLSFNSVTNELDVVAQYAFSWDDGQTHSYDVFTSKAVNLVLVLADGIPLTPTVGPAPTYSGLNAGVFGPAISFGSGSSEVANSDPKSSRSIVDWESVAVFRDSKIGDPTAAGRRYVGVYVGGPADLLSSYALHQIDWSVPHVYRIVRNPLTSVSVYVDGGPIPVISVAYDLLGLPPSSSSFMSGISSAHSSVAFGAFNPAEISRTRWDFFRYSIGRITLTDGLVPEHHVLNWHNAVASPDHLFTQKPHPHGGFTAYSGGTPLDHFMADEEVPAYTELGEGTPPVPMTQDMRSRGGLNKVGTPVDGIPATAIVDAGGFMTDLDDDSVNAVTAPTATDLPSSVALVNDFRSSYLQHLVQPRIHLADDVENGDLPDEASDLSSAIELANAGKAAFNSHGGAVIREVQKVHSTDDAVNVVTAPDATDLTSLIALLNEMVADYDAHRTQSGVHGSTLFIRLDPPRRVLYDSMKFFRFETGTDGLTAPFSDDETLHMDGLRLQGGASVSYGASVLPEDQELLAVQLLSNDLRTKYEAHRTEAGIHPADDLVNSVTAPAASDLPTALTLLTDIKSKLNAHLVQAGVHVADDPRNASFGAGPTALKMAQALVNELKLKFEAHRVSLLSHLLADDVNEIGADDAAPVADPGWRRFDSGPGFPSISLQTVGPIDVLRYGTAGSGLLETVYRRDTGIPDDPSLEVELTVSLRVNAFLNVPNVDTGIYAGMLSSSGPGVAVAIGFDAIDNVPYVKLQDVNADVPVFRAPFNWADGSFHTFKIVKDAATGGFGLVVVS